MRGAGWVTALPSLLLPQKRVLQEAADRTHRCLDDAHPAVQKSTAQEILPPEMHGGAQREITPPRAPPPRREPARARLRVRDELLEVVTQVAVRCVIELLRERPDVAQALKARMHDATAVTELTPGETHNPVVAPVSPPEHAPVECVTALHAIGFACRSLGPRLHGHHLPRQLWSDPLIGIQREDPLVPGDRDTAVALLGDAAGTVGDDARARGARERYRAVRGSAVDDHHVGRPVEVADTGDRKSVV